MKLKIFTLIDSVPSLRILSQKEISDQFRLKTSYNFLKTFKNVMEEVGAFDRIRIARLEALAEKDENGKALKEENSNFKLSPESLKIFQEEYAKMVNEEVEIYCSPMSITELEEIFTKLENEEKPKKGKSKEKEEGKFKISSIDKRDLLVKLEWLFTE